MDQLQMTPQSAFAASGAGTAERVTSFLRKVYGWMFVGLGITAAVALRRGGLARTRAVDVSATGSCSSA